jgi:hypothetical protein
MSAIRLIAFLFTSAMVTGSWAGVTCTMGGSEVPIGESMSDFVYSARGVPGEATGKISHFRLMAMGTGDAKTSSNIQLKTVDVKGPGSYPVVNESLWRSTVRERGKNQKTTGGRFVFTKFDVNGMRGHAVGTVEYTTEQSKGACSFDVEFTAVNRDR